MTSLWRFWIETQEGRTEAVEVRAPSEGAAYSVLRAARPEGTVVTVVRVPTPLLRAA